jgi:putative oxidoreductase
MLVRRLYSTFAPGGPGVGLLLLRVVAGIALLARWPENGQLPLRVPEVATGILLAAGLWTPIAGGLLAVLELWRAVSATADRWAYILLAAIVGALALLGPGAWSVDARLFGWKRIDIHNRNN